MSKSILIEGRLVPGYYDINNKYIAGKYIPSKRVEIHATGGNVKDIPVGEPPLVSAYAKKPEIPTVEPIVSETPVTDTQRNWFFRNPKKSIAGAIGLNMLRPGDKPEPPINTQNTNTQNHNTDHSNNWVGSIANHPNLLLGGTVAAGLGYLALKKMKRNREAL